MADVCGSRFSKRLIVETKRAEWKLLIQPSGLQHTAICNVMSLTIHQKII